MKRFILIASIFIYCATAHAQSIARNTGVPGVYSPLSAWGDSLTGGLQDGTSTTYPAVLSTLYSPVLNVLNKGVGGDTSSQILTRFLAATTLWGNGTLIWSGRNNYSSSAQVQSDIATMVADLTTQNYLVYSILNGENEPSGNSGYNQIVALNTALSLTYGLKYLDVRSMLVAAYNPAIAPDVIDHTNDVPPYSLRAVDVNGTLVGSLNSAATSFTTSTPVGVGYILTIGTEYIKILAASGTSVTSCTRGYASTIAASYTNGQVFTGVDPLHLNATGYTLAAQYVYRKIQSLGGWRQ